MNAKSTTGREFMVGLEAAGADKSKIMKLLDDTLEQNNPTNSSLDKKALMENISDNKLVANIKTRKAEISAVTGKYMFAEDYAYLAMNAYEKNGLGDAKDFKRDFIGSRKAEQLPMRAAQFSKVTALRQKMDIRQAL